MPEIPECLHRRYRALDELIKDLSTMSNRSSLSECNGECTRHDPGVKLMCDFWNILKEHPDCNLKKEVERRMGLGSNPSCYNQRVTCYMSDCCNKQNGKDEKSNNEELNKNGPCCDDVKSEPDPGPVHICCPGESPPPTSTSDVLPLSRVLCNLKEAASLDKDCSDRVTDLMIAQANLKEQIQELEQREKNGVNLLKQADCMWACMEDAYKVKIAESLERQKIILKELKEVEASATKWRKNKKDLEFQTNNVTKCQQEIIEKINQKTSDKKCLETEIADFKKRIENNKKDLDLAKKTLSNKKQASDAKIAAIATEMKGFQLKLQEEQKYKQDKETEGKNYIKEAREDLQKLCSMLLQKKLENEDLKAEKEAIVLEIDMLKQACDECKEKCNNKKQAVFDEIKSLDKEIANFTLKCIKCHECVDTSDVRKLCTDCPRCVDDRECLYEEGQCTTDPTADCVCTSIKHKFLDNVFDNMYTVLEKEAKTPPGKAVAEAVLKCLEKSRNGKLNSETRKILQEFILTTVKKNLNLTIVGGAVKTRCEMDPETYKQLMLCLKDVKVTRPPKTDTGTIAKKDACPRWTGSSECNCPKGPKACVCTKSIPEAPDDTPPEDSENKGKTKNISSNSKDTVACGINCEIRAVPSLVGTELTSRQPSCQEPSCPFTKNMRAAQCVLGPDSLSSPPKPKASPMPNILDLDSQISCTCGRSPEKSHKSGKDIKTQPRDRIIEEVMGRYTEVTPIEKVNNINEHDNRKYQGRNLIAGCNSQHKSNQHSVASNMSTKNVSQYCTCSIIYSPKKNKHIKEGSSSDFNNLSASRRNKGNYSSDETSTCPSEFIYENVNLDSKSEIGFALVSHPEHVNTSQGMTSACSKKPNQSDSRSCPNHTKSNKDSVLNSGSRLFGRNVSNVVKEIVKDIIESDLRAKDTKYSSSVQLITLKSLLTEVLSRTKINSSDSNITIHEKEITNEILEVKDYGKESKTEKCDQNSCLSAHLNEKNELKKYYINKAKNTSIDTRLDDLIDSTHPQFHITILNESGQIEDHFTELIKTPSGVLALEIDEKIIEIFEKRTKHDPNFMGLLTKDKRGHIRIDFTGNESECNDRQKIKIKRVHSGTISFQADQSFIHILKPGQTIAHIASKEQLKNDSLNPVKITPKYKNTLNTDKKVRDKENSLLKKMVKKKILQESKSVCNYYDQGNKTITLKIQDDHDFSKYIVSEVTKTPPKNIVFEIEKIQNLENVIVKTGQYPVLLDTADSNTFILDLRKQSNKPCNAILKRVCKGYLLTVNDSMIKTSDDNENFIKASGKECFKMRLKGANINVVNPPMVLKRTPSNNYVMSVDKEYEREYKEIINRYIDNDDTCCVNLEKTNFGNDIIITFEESNNDDERSEPNAYLIKASSGTIKVVTNGPEFHYIERSISGSKRSSKAFEELLHKLTKSTLKNQRESITKCRFITGKCQSYPYLSSKTRFLNTFTDSSTLVKKTASGQYFVVLNKESKKAFIKKMKGYLAKNSQGLVPIRRTISEQIIIIYNKDEGSADQNGTLRITSSGNICVLIDEKIILNRNKHENSANADDTNLNYSLGNVENLLNKGVGTTCNGNPTQCSCIASKCICEELQCCMSDWLISHPDVKYPDDISTVCAFRKYKESSLPNIHESDKRNNVKQRIIIKPRDCQTFLEKRRIHFEDTESICTFHKDRYDNVSNELLEICSIANGTKKFLKRKNNNKPNKINFDYIEHLPPQLPPFLKDFSVI